MTRVTYAAGNGIKSAENNGNEIALGKILQVYTGTDFNSSAIETDGSGTGVTSTNSAELTAISASDLGNADYIVIEVNGTSFAGTQDSRANAYTQMKVQTKEIGGTYSDSSAYSIIQRSRYTSINNYNQTGGSFNYRWVHTLTAGEKSNGVQVKIFGLSYAESFVGPQRAGSSINNVQTVIRTGV